MTARTQIYLDVEEHRRARVRAAEQGISMSEYVRRLVHRDLDRAEPGKLASIEDIFGLDDSGEPTDIARDKDRLIGEAVEALRPRP